MRHSLSKDTAFNRETAQRHTFLCSDSQCLLPGDPTVLCAKYGYPITGKSFIDKRFETCQSKQEVLILKCVIKVRILNQLISHPL